MISFISCFLFLFVLGWNNIPYTWRTFNVLFKNVFSLVFCGVWHLTFFFLAFLDCTHFCVWDFLFYFGCMHPNDCERWASSTLLLIEYAQNLSFAWYPPFPLSSGALCTIWVTTLSTLVNITASLLNINTEEIEESQMNITVKECIFRNVFSLWKFKLAHQV